MTTLTDSDALGALSCTDGDLPESDGARGWTCLDSASFAPAVHAHDDRYFTETEMGGSGSAALHWDNLTSVPSGFADGVDDDTTYSAGDGMVLAGTTISSAPDARYSPGVIARDNQISSLVDRHDLTCADAISIAIQADGLPMVACAAADRALLVGTCSDAACSVINFTTPGTGVSVGSTTSIVVPVPSGDPTPPYLVVFSDGGNLALATDQSSGSLGFPGDHASIGLGFDGFPMISFAFGSDKIGFLDCDDASCASFTRTDIDPQPGDPSNEVTHTAVALGVDGLPVVAYRDEDQVGIVRCLDAGCTTIVGEIPVGAGNAPDHALSLVIDEGGRPAIAFGTVGDGAGLFIDGVGVREIDPPVSPGVTAGEHAAVTMAGDGRLAVAYWDETNGHLKYAHCNDDDCTSWTNLAIDPAVATNGNVGSHVALSFGGDGRPLAVYIEDVSGTHTARALKCANSYCVPFFQRR